MSKIYRVSIIGDKKVKNIFKFEKKILKIVTTLIEEHEQVEFYFDNYSEIGLLTTLKINSVRSSFKNQNFKLVLILTSKEEVCSFYEFLYNDIKYPKKFDESFNTMEKRNKWLINNCDLLITNIENKKGEMWKNLEYANKIKVKQVNLG